MMAVRTGKRNAPSERGGGFVYKKRTVESVKERANQKGGSFDSPFKKEFDVFRPKDGENVIRILPATWDDHEHYGYDLNMHRWIGADNSNYLCLNKMQGKPCPACEEAKAAKDAGEDDEARQLGQGKRTLAWVIDRNDKADPPVPQLYDMSWAQDRDIAGMCHTERTGKILLIDHPDDGYDITIRKTGTGLKTKYQFIIDREPSPIDESQKAQDGILEFIQENPLPTVLRFDTYEHIAKQLAGVTDKGDKELADDDDETPKKRKRAADDDDDDAKPTRRSRAKADDDDDDEPAPKKRARASDDDDDDEPAPKKGRARASAEDDDDETPRRRAKAADDDDDTPPRKRTRVSDDDDDEPAPKKKRAAVEDDDDEPPRRRKAAVEDDEDDEPAPKKKRAAAEDDDDDETPPPRKRARATDDDDDAPPKKKRAAVEDDDDDEPAPKKKRAAVEDDDDEPPPRRRAR